MIMSLNTNASPSTSYNNAERPATAAGTTTSWRSDLQSNDVETVFRGYQSLNHQLSCGGTSDFVGVINEGGVAAMVNTMKEHSENYKIYQATLIVLCHLTKIRVVEQHRADDCGEEETEWSKSIMDSLVAPAVSEEAISLVSVGEEVRLRLRRDFVSSGGVQAILYAMHRNGVHATTQIRCMWILAKLDLLLPSLSLALLPQQHQQQNEQCRFFVELAFTAIENHFENPGVVIVALASILTIVQGNDNNSMNLDAPKMVARTLDCLNLLEGNLFDKVVPIVARILWCLVIGTSRSKDSDNSSAQKVEIVYKLVDAMKKNPRSSHGEFQRHVCNIVGHLICNTSKETADDDCSLLLAMEFTRAGGIYGLVQTIRHNVERAQVVESAVWVLYLLIQRLHPQQHQQQEHQEDPTTTRIAAATDDNLQPLLLSTLIFTDAAAILQACVLQWQHQQNETAATIASMAYRAWTRLYAVQTSVAPEQEQDSDSDDYIDDDCNDDDSMYF